MKIGSVNKTYKEKMKWVNVDMEKAVLKMNAG